YHVSEYLPSAASGEAPLLEFGGTQSYSGSVFGLATNQFGDVYISDSGQNIINVYGVPRQTLKYTPAGTGGGTATGPLSFECSSSCEGSFPEAAEVLLTAHPNSKSVFVAWSGCGSTSGSGGEVCHATMNGQVEVEAEFEMLPQQTLTVRKSGRGKGTVKSS